MSLYNEKLVTSDNKEFKYKNKQDLISLTNAQILIQDLF